VLADVEEVVEQMRLEIHDIRDKADKDAAKATGAYVRMFA
jgi:hypothetical protein